MKLETKASKPTQLRLAQRKERVVPKSSLNVFTLISCKWCYCEVKAFGNHNNSAMKIQNKFRLVPSNFVFLMSF